MLKLIPASDVSFDSVINYGTSFNNIDDYECRILDYADISEYSYKTALKDLEKNNGHVYYLINEENENYLLGIGLINNINADYHKPILDTGCIALSVRPDERNKGYASKLLSLLVDECKTLGLKEVCISCYEENLASKRVIEKTGGILERIFTNYGRGALKYWIPTERKKDKIKCRTLNVIGKRKSNC